MEVSQLPAELQEAILSYLDGPSLARSQRVCKRWKNIIDNLGKVGNIWFDKCLQELPSGVLMLFVGDMPRRTAGSWQQWQELYRRWYRSRFVRNWKCSIVWQQRHFTQSNISDRIISSSSLILKFCGAELVLYGYTEIARWDVVSGRKLPTRDIVGGMGAINNKSVVVLDPLISTGTGTCSSSSDQSEETQHYPCTLMALGNNIFLFTKSEMKAFQQANLISCMGMWSRTLLIGWVSGAVDLYTLADDLLTSKSLQELKNPCHLIPPIFNNWQQGGFFRQNITKASAAVLVGNRAFLIRSPNIEVWDVKKQLLMTSELYGSTHPNTLVANGVMLFCLTGSTLTWFEWSEENNELLPGQTPENVPGNATCMTLYGDLLAIGTSEGLIYLYHLNETTLVAAESADRTDDDSDPSDDDTKAVPYNWDPVLSFKRMSILHKTNTMRLVEGALTRPIHTFSLPGCGIVSAIAVSDGGSGPLVAAVGIPADETWLQHIHMFSWTR